MMKVTTAHLAPHQCALTGTPTGPFIDTEIEDMDIGRVYFGRDAVVAMAVEFGMVEGGKVPELKAEIAELRKQNHDLSRRLEAFRTIMAEVDPGIIEEVRCQYCGSDRSKEGTPFHLNKRALSPHERWCPENPNRELGAAAGRLAHQ